MFAGGCRGRLVARVAEADGAREENVVADFDGRAVGVEARRGRAIRGLEDAFDVVDCEPVQVWLHRKHLPADKVLHGRVA